MRKLRYKLLPRQVDISLQFKSMLKTVLAFPSLETFVDSEKEFKGELILKL
ncbi:hypothetical protein WN51_02508 [Melipona quadrifasciata]|uniref:Uncharacterized protein n=1 Tax=Melipona quadrifasciata TaxID=166423 RepID=A0A0N0U3R0_9HYME|nr:hypothetical protein WN51_02508 [Melipona quadrifasciata]